MGAPVGEGLGEVGGEGEAGPLHMGGLVGVPERVQALDQALGPVPESLELVMGNAQDGGDHVDRDRHAEQVHQVDFGLGPDPVQGLIDDPLDLGPEAGHPGVKGA